MRQSVNGKVMTGVGKLALKYSVPAFGITGCLGEGYEELLSMGFKNIIPCKDDNMDVDYAMTHGRELLAARTRELMAKLN